MHFSLGSMIIIGIKLVLFLGPLTVKIFFRNDWDIEQLVFKQLYETAD
jgi:hypothetical protein